MAADNSLLQIVLLILALLTIGTGYRHLRTASPVDAIFNRWLRWIFFSVAIPYLILEMGWIERPFWALALATFICWFLADTMYNWVFISAINNSSISLFPKYSVNETGSDWPNQREFIAIRNWLRKKGFKKTQSIIGHFGESLIMRLCVYQNEQHVRLQVNFMPQANGNVTVCYILQSITADGKRLITDNYFFPFGGFYPENWLLERRPWMRSLDNLYKRHISRMDALREEFVAWETDPVDDLKRQQYRIEQVNTEMGFLFPYQQQHDYGKITWEGRYRLWKEIWALNYLGKPLDYMG